MMSFRYDYIISPGPILELYLELIQDKKRKFDIIMSLIFINLQEFQKTQRSLEEFR